MRPDLELLLEASYRTVVGRDLRTDAGGDLYDAPAALLMHGNEPDPVFCYANRTAQGLWGLTWDEFIRLPSRLSAEPLVQAERDRLLARVRAMASSTTIKACGSRRTARASAFRARWCGWWWLTARHMGRQRCSGSGRPPEPGPRSPTLPEPGLIELKSSRWQHMRQVPDPR
jgi:hypothetical protein